MTSLSCPSALWVGLAVSFSVHFSYGLYEASQIFITLVLKQVLKYE